jgi:hypothetical protein
MKKEMKMLLIQLTIIILILVGEIKCIVKAVNCDWDPVGKAEVIYTASAMCGLGSIVGWMDIEDTAPITFKDTKKEGE